MRPSEWKDDFGKLTLVEFGPTELSIIIQGSKVLSFKEAEEIYLSLATWIGEQREKCNTCGTHERDGCRTHDG